MTTTDRESRLLEAFAVLADTLVADYDVIDLLQTLVDTCQSLLDIDAAGLLLADPDTGELDLVVSTSESSRIVEALQLSGVAGPCVDAFQESRIVSAPDIALMGGRFSGFRDTALAQGFHSVYAIPMRLRNTTIGALNLFRADAGELNAPDVRAAQALTEVATIGILIERSMRASDLLRGRLQHALNSRIVVEQAKGVLAHMHDVSMEEAFARIRTFARAERRSILDVSKSLVERTLIF